MNRDSRHKTYEEFGAEPVLITHDTYGKIPIFAQICNVPYLR